MTASLSNSAGLSNTTAATTLTLTDDDMAGLALTGLQAADPKATLAEDGTAVFRVALASAPTGTVTVAASSGASGVCLVSKAGDAMPAASTTLTFTSGNWSAAQAVTLTGVRDNLAAGGRDCAVTLATASAGAGGDAVYHSTTEVPDQSFTARGHGGRRGGPGGVEDVGGDQRGRDVGLVHGGRCGRFRRPM